MAGFSGWVAPSCLRGWVAPWVDLNHDGCTCDMFSDVILDLEISEGFRFWALGVCRFLDLGGIGN